MPKKTLQKIQHSALKLLEPLSTQELYKTCVNEAIHLVGGVSGSLFLEKNDKLIRVYSSVPADKRLIPRPEGFTKKSFADGRIRFVTQAAMRRAHPNSDFDYQAVIIIPLSYGAKRLGVITVHTNDPTKYSPLLKGSLKVFGSLATMVIRNMDLYERSKSALKAREFFLSAAAHELKTPVAVIQAYAQLAQQKVKQKKPIKQEWLNSILSNTARLQNLMTDLFNVSQMSMGIFSYDFSKVDPAEILTEIISDNSVIQKRTIDFKNLIRGEAPLLDADPTKLKLVFSNIIGNAIKYSSAPSPVKVILRKTSTNYHISVVDQGIGIPPEDLPYVFERFFQGKVSKSSGMGLGMYLCKQVVLAHHGDITISSKPDVGTTVHTYLPFK